MTLTLPVISNGQQDCEIRRLRLSSPLSAFLNMASQQIVVVSGPGNATGTGASCARLFAQEGFLVALVSRPRQEVDNLTKEINQAGGTVSTRSLSRRQ